MLIIPGLPPAASAWTITSSVAAAVSYADRKFTKCVVVSVDLVLSLTRT